MTTTATGYRYVELDDQGAAVLTGTRIKVAHLIEQMQAWGLTPEQAREGFPQLSLAQVHSALAYYHDHAAEIDRQIARDAGDHDAARAAQRPRPSRAALEARLGASREQ
jgi:uncharacterized protein (DUF433 family)